MLVTGGARPRRGGKSCSAANWAPFLRRVPDRCRAIRSVLATGEPHMVVDAMRYRAGRPKRAQSGCADSRSAGSESLSDIRLQPTAAGLIMGGSGSSPRYPLLRRRVYKRAWLSTAAEFDADLARRYPALISPVLSEHPLRFAATACGARFRPTTQVLDRTHHLTRSVALVALSASRSHTDDGKTGASQRRSSLGRTSADRQRRTTRDLRSESLACFVWDRGDR